MGIGLIPFTSINEYAKRYGIEEIDAFEAFLLLIKAMDSVYIEVRNTPAATLLLNEIDPEDSDYVKLLLGAEDRETVVSPPSEPPHEPVNADGIDVRDDSSAANPRRVRRARKGAAGQPKPRGSNARGGKGER